jgi:antitoxin ParD1/3/4
MNGHPSRRSSGLAGTEPGLQANWHVYGPAFGKPWAGPSSFSNSSAYAFYESRFKQGGFPCTRGRDKIISKQEICHMAIHLGDFEKYVQELVKSGQYKDDSEAVQAALGVYQLHEDKLASLREDIREGIESGDAGLLDMDDIIASAKERLKANGA